MTDHTPVRKKRKSRALRASQVNPDWKCTQCTLCNENANFCVHSVNWKPSKVSLLHRLAPGVSETNCICWACGEDIKRGVHLSEYTPRWVKKLQHKTKVCAIPDCITNTESVKVTTIGTIDQLQNVLNCDICNHHFEDGIYLSVQSTIMNSLGALTWLLLVLVVEHCLGEGKGFFVTPQIPC